MSGEPRLRIGGEDFSLVRDPKAGDFVACYQVTGLDGDQWSKAWTTAKLQAFIGWVAMSVRRKHPDWTFEQLREFVGNIDFDEIDRSELNPGPPAEPPKEEEETPSATSSDESTTTPELYVEPAPV